MTLLWRTHPVRLLAAALLLVGSAGASKVICISPTGHQGIEDSAAFCCADSGGASGTSLSEAAPCQGCTDYPIASAIGINRPQTDSSRAVSYDDSAVLTAEPAGLAQMPSIGLTLGFGRQLDPFNSQPLITSLRC